MRTSVIRIGNSKGVRIPKAVLQQCQIGGELSMEVQDGRIVLSPVGARPREGWRAAFMELRAAEEEAKYIPDALDLDVGEWEW